MNKKLSQKQSRTLYNDKRSNHQEDTTITNIYSCNIRAPKYIKQTLTELTRKIDRSAIIVDNFNVPLLRMERQLPYREQFL